MLDSHGLLWPDTPEEVDSDLFEDVKGAATRVLDSGLDGSARQLLRADIKQFLDEIRPSGHILIKPSTAGGRPVDHEVSPAILEFVVETVCACVPASRVVVGEGPAYTSFSDECERLGWTSIFRRFGVHTVDLNLADARTVANRWPLAVPFMEAACVINLCKARTHRRFGASLGLKGLVGALVGRELGSPKLPGLHRAVPRLLYHLAQVSPPALTLIDGIRGLEGEGPLSGTHAPSRFLSIGRGYYGPDVRATIEMGFDPVLIPYFVRPRSGDRGAGKEAPWLSLRQTKVDFFPPRSCRWLFRSILTPKARSTVFPLLSEELKSYWADRDLFP